MRQMRLPRPGFKNLLFWIILYIIVTPFLAAVPYSNFIFQTSISAVLFFAVYAVSKSGKLSSAAIVLLALTLMLQWVGHLSRIPFYVPLTYLMTALYLSLLIYGFFQEIFRAKRVTPNLIAATLCLYLIIGFLFGNTFGMLEALSPGSFSGALLEAAESPLEGHHSFIYFSFITLTTLGYGDITPQTQGATALCQAEAIIGQFFIAVLVARLVGIEASQKPENEDDDEL
jgi:voltage-gated potassium channel